ncbi:MAG: ABC-F family ATP-binding cassette domain-containing protein [Sphingobacteriales bacterium]|nr:MAG: ABC-F family ATP-binding cassette domain-containing protein [Sphingobacteriales bacterium]
MLILQNLTYTHPDKDVLFTDIDLAINRQDKIALVGNNGSGKSTLLKIMTGMLQPASGIIKADSRPYYVPQLTGQYNGLTIAQALGVADKLQALQQILAGNVSEANMNTLNDDWTIEERCAEAMLHWQLQGFNLDTKMATLSGGEKTKVLLAGIDIHQPEIVLLDEPSNHLDSAARKLLYEYVAATNNTLVVVSHDRALLNLLPATYELSKLGITIYGGNYDFYAEQKAIESSALNSDVRSKEKALRKAKETEREAMKRKQKQDARGRKKQDKAGVPTIMLNTLRNNAEKSSSRIKDMHAEKIGDIAQELNELRKELPDADRMKIGFEDSGLHTGKILVTARDINFSYNSATLWQQSLNFIIISGQRIAVKGLNGSGKTTLIKLILGQLQPIEGTLERAITNAVYIDQDYSLIDNGLTVYDQALQYNTDNLQEHEVKSKLTHFLFTKAYWDKPCNTLSGGEKMRLMLCCLTIAGQAPDIIILDEPTNNLDMQNVDILTNAIEDYKGTIIAISHDAYFLQQIGIQEKIELK